MNRMNRIKPAASVAGRAWRHAFILNILYIL
jgi:hypothetical protein